ARPVRSAPASPPASPAAVVLVVGLLVAGAQQFVGQGGQVVQGGLLGPVGALQASARRVLGADLRQFARTVVAAVGGTGSGLVIAHRGQHGRLVRGARRHGRQYGRLVRRARRHG